MRAFVRPGSNAFVSPADIPVTQYVLRPALFVRSKLTAIVTSSLNPSVFHAVRKSLGSFATYSAIITYMASCIVVTTLYLWSAKPKDVLGFVSEGRFVNSTCERVHNLTTCRSYERPRLNERFLYLSFLACYAGFAQGINHTCRDRGKLDLSDSSVRFELPQHRTDEFLTTASVPRKKRLKLGSLRPWQIRFRCQLLLPSLAPSFTSRLGLLYGITPSWLPVQSTGSSTDQFAPFV